MGVINSAIIWYLLVQGKKKFPLLSIHLEIR